MTFDPEGSEPKADKSIDQLSNLTGFEYARVSLACADRSKRINLSGKRFSHCDCSGHLEKASFTNCEFLLCNFTGTHCSIVKFTRCTFRRCHFLHTDFNECRFIDCHFQEISVAAEHFRVNSTAIDVTQFLAAVTNNLCHLPDSTTPEYQRSRLKRDKAKLASILYRSNQELFGRHYFAAHKELIVCSIHGEIEEQRFLEPQDGGTTNCKPRPRGKLSFLRRTFMSYAELVSVYLAGALTDWGQSIARAFLFISAVVPCFCLLYEVCFSMPLYQAVLRSADVSLVAGYTAHIHAGDSTNLRLVTLLNLIVGLYWYSLIVPVVTRKFLR